MGILVPSLLLAGLALPARSAPTVHPRSDGERSGLVLFHGGRIRLNDALGTVVDALLVEDGRVIAAGRMPELLARAEGRELARIDLFGGVAVPGLQDAHVRMAHFGGAPDYVELGACTTLAEVAELVATVAANEPEGRWIEGRGLSRELSSPQNGIDHRLLSAALPRHPVLLLSNDGAAALVNAAAMERTGIDAARAAALRVPGGTIVLDRERRPTGLLLGNAIQRVVEQLPPRSPEARARAILRAQDEFLVRGVTCIHDMGVDRATLETYGELRSRGLLKLRVVAYLDVRRGIDRALAAEYARTRPGADGLSVAGLHLPLDGPLAREDWLAIDASASSFLTGEAQLAELLDLSARLGLQPALEAHGERAARTALDLVQTIGSLRPALGALRPRIEGAELVAPRDWRRFPALGVLASVQPLRASVEFDLVEERLTEDRVRRVRGWWALAPELGSFAYGSAWPAAEPSPLQALYTARRTHADEVGSVAGTATDAHLGALRALAGFTDGAARAARQEARRGRLLPGFAADLTVLDLDPIECAAEKLLGARVLMTVIDGEVVHRADGG